MWAALKYITKNGVDVQNIIIIIIIIIIITIIIMIILIIIILKGKFYSQWSLKIFTKIKKSLKKSKNTLKCLIKFKKN